MLQEEGCGVLKEDVVRVKNWWTFLKEWEREQN